MQSVSYYFQRGFWSLTDEEEFEILQFIREKGIIVPVLYRGLELKTEEISEIGDVIFLNYEHAFASMSRNFNDAYAFGNVILVCKNLQAVKVEESEMIDEWLVEDQKLHVTAIEEKNGVILVYCE